MIPVARFSKFGVLLALSFSMGVLVAGCGGTDFFFLD